MIRFILQLDRGVDTEAPTQPFQMVPLGKPDVDDPHEHMCPDCGEWWTCTRAMHSKPRSEPFKCDACRRSPSTRFFEELASERRKP